MTDDQRDENEKPEQTTYIARTARGWAASPDRHGAMARALTHARPDPEEDTYIIEVFEVDATDWSVNGLGGIRSTYCRNVETLKFTGEQAREVCDKFNEIEDLLARPEEVIDE